MPDVPSLEVMRAIAALQGVTPSDEDLEAVQAFLAVLLPQFRELESVVPPGTVPAGMFVPDEAP